MIKFAIRFGMVFGDNQWEMVVTPLRWRLGIGYVEGMGNIETLQLFVGPIGFLVARGEIWQE